MWKAENGKINPGVDSAKSIFSGVDQGRGRGGFRVYQGLTTRPKELW
jgi:hypothetical protein